MPHGAGNTWGMVNRRGRLTATVYAIRPPWSSERAAFVMDGQDVWGTPPRLNLAPGVTSERLLAWLQAQPWKDLSFSRGEDGIAVHAREVRRPPEGFVYVDGTNVSWHYIGWLALSMFGESLRVDARLCKHESSYAAVFYGVVDAICGVSQDGEPGGAASIGWAWPASGRKAEHGQGWSASSGVPSEQANSAAATAGQMQPTTEDALEEIPAGGDRQERPAGSKPGDVRQHKTREDTEKRDAFLKELKDGNPGLSQAQLALNANDHPKKPDGRPFTSDDVNNAWDRHSEWGKWLRGNLVQ
jgi:hypothetical protein